MHYILFLSKKSGPVKNPLRAKRKKVDDISYTTHYFNLIINYLENVHITAKSGNYSCFEPIFLTISSKFSLSERAAFLT